MDAKTIRNLVWLAALSLFCATTAWAVGHAVFGAVFFAFGTVAGRLDQSLSEKTNVMSCIFCEKTSTRPVAATRARVNG